MEAAILWLHKHASGTVGLPTDVCWWGVCPNPMSKPMSAQLNHTICPGYMNMPTECGRPIRNGTCTWGPMWDPGIGIMLQRLHKAIEPMLIRDGVLRPMPAKGGS